MQRHLYSIIFFLVIKLAAAQNPVANAGPDFTVCPGGTGVLGSSVPASGGTPPYTYQWAPVTGLSCNTCPNPTVTVNTQTTYTLTVRDATNKLGSDVVTVYVSSVMIYGPGKDSTYCYGTASNIVLGSPSNSASAGATFTWTPAAGLNNANSPNPVANPVTSTIYTLTVTKSGCTAQTGTVMINVTYLNMNLAFHDTLIKEGQTITLISNTSLPSYTWTPLNSYIKYPNSAQPDVNPLANTTYTVKGTDNNGCIGIDTVRVRVEPSDDLVFYSAFTPNADGVNDYFFIGNIQKYPDNVLKIYNRYGQVIFTAANYQNDWNGEYQGNKIPTGTYFYILYTNTDKGNYSGSVTILR
jgi:gliding motility-associated-like protein